MRSAEAEFITLVQAALALVATLPSAAMRCLPQWASCIRQRGTARHRSRRAVSERRPQLSHLERP